MERFFSILSCCCICLSISCFSSISKRRFSFCICFTSSSAKIFSMVCCTIDSMVVVIGVAIIVVAKVVTMAIYIVFSFPLRALLNDLAFSRNQRITPPFAKGIVSIVTESPHCPAMLSSISNNSLSHLFWIFASIMWELSSIQ